MPAINRYILAELLKVFLVALLALTALLLFSDVTREMRNKGLGFAQIVLVLPYLLPYAMRTSMQGALLFAICSVYGRMAATNEIVAVKSMGISPMKLVWPTIWCVGIPLSLLGTWLDDLGASWGEHGMARVIIDSTDEVAYGMLKTHRSYAVPKQQFAIAVKNVEGRRLIKPTLIFTPPGEKHEVTIVAEEGELRVDRVNSRLTILMHKGTINVSTNKFEMRFDDTIEQALPLDSKLHNVITRELIDEQAAVVAKLRQEIKDMGRVPANVPALVARHEELTRQVQAEQHQLNFLQMKFHQKWANSFCCLAFVLIGIPVSVTTRRGDFLTSFMICFLPIVSAYQPLQFVGASLAQSGDVPAYTVWFGNFVLFGIGVWLLRKVEKF